MTSTSSSFFKSGHTTVHAVGIPDVLVNLTVVEVVRAVGVVGEVLGVAGDYLPGDFVGVDMCRDIMISVEIAVEKGLVAVAGTIECVDRDTILAVGKIGDVLVAVEGGVPMFCCLGWLRMADGRSFPSFVAIVVIVRVDDVLRCHINPPFLGVSHERNCQGKD